MFRPPILLALCVWEGFAVVKLATDKQTGEEFACKIMALPEPNTTAGDNENTRYCFMEKS